MRLTEHQAVVYRKLVEEMGAEEAHDFWKEEVAPNWKQWSRLPTRDEQAIVSFMNGIWLFGTLAVLARQPELVTGPIEQVGRSLRAVMSLDEHPCE